jgi:hypothetical protein
LHKLQPTTEQWATITFQTRGTCVKAEANDLLLTASCPYQRTGTPPVHHTAFLAAARGVFAVPVTTERFPPPPLTVPLLISFTVPVPLSDSLKRSTSPMILVLSRSPVLVMWKVSEDRYPNLASDPDCVIVCVDITSAPVAPASVRPITRLLRAARLVELNMVSLPPRVRLVGLTVGEEVLVIIRSATGPSAPLAGGDSARLARKSLPVLLVGDPPVGEPPGVKERIRSVGFGFWGSHYVCQRVLLRRIMCHSLRAESLVS